MNHARIPITPLFLLISFLSQNLFHVMNFWLLVLIVQICPMMYEFVTLAIYFGNHLILLVDAGVAITYILLGLICRFNTIVRSGIAAMGLATSS